MSERSARKPRRRECNLRQRAAFAVCSAAVASVGAAAELPVPCAGAACGAHGPQQWVSPGSGGAALSQNGNRLDINQSTNSVQLNWKSFNISADGTVNFNQPSPNAVALNRVFDVNRSLIQGALNANGKVYLLNQNGFIFGSGAKVNVGGLIASSLDMTPEAVANGVAGAILSSKAAFQPYVDEQGKPITNTGVIEVQPGASITSNQGQVMLFAPTVDNQGTISTPSGQTILGAGQRVFLAVSNDADIRGLLIEVGGNGTVINGGGAGGSVGQISADAGNVTLAALAVKQDGHVAATTTVRSNGSIRLQARATTDTSVPAQGVNLRAFSASEFQYGTAELGDSSSTTVSLQGGSSDTTVDVNAQPKSNIDIEAAQIQVLNGAAIVAPGGNVSLTATPDIVPADITSRATKDGSSRIWLAPTTVIDVSGADVSLPVSDNSLSVQLRGSQLADFPQQRDGALRGLTVSVDIRQHGVRGDGTAWVGTPLADLTGDVSTIQRDVFERNLTGGTITLNSSGSVLVGQGATLNVSGGQIDWQAGFVRSSMLLGADGKTYSISQADPNRTYVGTLDSISQSDAHWGTTVTYSLAGRDPRGTYQAGYVEGKDAGSVAILAPAFILDGNISGSAVRGPLQRMPATNFAANPLYQGQLYRFSDEVPEGATLTIGNAGGLDLSPTADQREVLQSLIFASNPVLPGLRGSGGAPFNPATDALPDQFVSSLRPDLLGVSGVSQLNVYAEGTVTVPQGTLLAPGPGGSIELAAGRINFAGTVRSTGGSVTLQSTPTLLFGGTTAGGPLTSDPTRLELSADAVIDTRGAWVNDDPLLGQSGQQPLFIKGGSVQLLATSGGDFVVPAGVSIDVSGGAQRTSAGKLVAGAGGSISVAATPSPVIGNAQSKVEMGASLTGFGLSDGGSLSLAFATVCLSSTDCKDPTAFRVDPSWLTDFGFERVSLAAVGGKGLVVAPDVNTDVQQRNLQFTRGAFSHPSDSSLASITTVVSLADFQRHPENLSLTATSSLPLIGPAPFADLTIAAGANLDFDPTAAIAFSTNSRLFMDGAIRDPAGSVSLSITGGLQPVGAETILPNQAIWLGPQSSIDVSGVAQLKPTDLGLKLGTVLPGGSVALSAGRGYILALPGSQILANGSSSVLDLNSPGSGSYTRQSVTSAGGAISVSASEGMQLDGDLTAASGGGVSSGGSLSLSLDGNAARSDFSYAANAICATTPGCVLNDPTRSVAPRVLTVAASGAPTVIGEGGNVPAFLNGEGRISAAAIDGGGFDNVKLTTHDLVLALQNALPNGATTVAVQSAVTFDTGVSLSPRASLTIDSPVIRASGSGSVTLNSAYVSLGSRDASSQIVASATAAGEATLDATAQLIELVGMLNLDRFGAATLSSSGDIRTIGVQRLGNGAPTNAGFAGMLNTPGTLTMSAQQIYPTTLTSYAINLTSSDPTQSVLTITSAPGTPGEVLSAAGSLTLTAHTIVDSGVIRAPIGTVSLVGDDVTLSSGAILSVSANGAAIPFGQTQGGFDWVYNLNPATQVLTVYGTGAGDVALPEKQVQISAGNLQFDSGATIDTSGGGDLLGYEYTPGLGGTRDLLSPTIRPGTFAVLPGVTLPYAPIDPNEDRGFTQPVGASVHLSGGNGLPAGTYALLPARYALLPGAFLVTPVSGYTDLASGETVAQLDGSVVVSGYRTTAGTGTRDSRLSGFDVMPGSYAFKEAQYSVTSANTFFAAQAAANDAPVPRLPADAGVLALQITQSVQLQGTLNGTASTGARGGALDFAGNGSDLFITGNPGDAPAGSVILDTGQLSHLGAQSLLLGATRSTDGDFTDLNSVAKDVTLDQGAVLTAPEVILAATGSITLEANARITASGSAVASEPGFQALPGTAVVRASTGPQASLTPLMLPAGGDSTPLTASIAVASGASVTAPGSMSFDAGGRVDFAGSISAQGADVRLGGTQIALGATPDTFTGFAISPTLIAGLANSSLTLNAATPVQFYGLVDLALNDLTVVAPGFVGAAPDAQSPAPSLTVTANTVTLGNNGGDQTTFATPSSGNGTVTVTAQHVMLGAGTFAISGVASTTLTATQDLTSVDDGTLSTAGSLALRSPILQSAAGKDFTFNVGGDLTAALSGSTAGSPTTAAGPGGSFAFNGRSVTLGGNIVLPGGQIEATALEGPLQVVSGAILDVSGFSKTFDNETISATGGNISLASAAGDLTIAPNALLDVSSGSGAGAGGSLSLSAPAGTVSIAGTVRGSGAVGQPGGSMSVDARTLDFPGLVSLAGTAGFSDQFAVRARIGNFVLDSGTTLRAADVSLTADMGSIYLLGSVNATTDLGGKIVIAARDSIYLSGSLSAGSASRSDRGGTVDLFTTNGGLFLDSGSSINVGGLGSVNGTVWLRESQSQLETLLNPGTSGPQFRLAGAINGAANIYLEGYNAYYTVGNLSITENEQSTYLADAQAFMDPTSTTGASAIATAIGGSRFPQLTIVPGIEVDSTGDMNVAADWDLSSWRFGNVTAPNPTPPGQQPSPPVAGVLTLRAGGNLVFDHSLSDGFSGLDPGSGGFTLDAFLPNSWSYRLVAGASATTPEPDSHGGSPLAVKGPTQMPTGGDLIVGAGKLATAQTGIQGPTVIRTGTGFIDIATAGDLRLTNQASVIYTAGTASKGAFTFEDSNSQFQDLNYPVNGGSINIDVGRNIAGATSNQLFTDWLWRTGVPSTGTTLDYLPTSWTPVFGFFEQGIGALGGGDLNIRAAGNISNLGANVPSTGIPQGNGQADGTSTTEVNAGMLRVSAGGDIAGGKFLDMAGQAFIHAGGALTAGTPQGPARNPLALNPVLGMGSGQFDISARRGIAIETAVDPTLLPQSIFQGGANSFTTYFATYGDSSRLNVTSVGDDVDWVNRTSSAADPLPVTSTNLNPLTPRDVQLRMLAPTLSAVSLGGDVDVTGALALWPSAHGNLQLLAAHGVNLVDAKILVSDADPTILPTLTHLAAPGSESIAFQDLDPVLYASTPTSLGLHALEPVHGGAFAADGQPDLVPARIVALTGDVDFKSSTANGILSLDVSKPIDIVAGGDIINPTLTVQQYSTNNVSSLIAGRDILYPSARDNTGSLVPNSAAIVVAGPGKLDVQAGRDVNLGTAGGITSIGNIYNIALPTSGADLSVSAGINSPPHYQDFINAYLGNSDLYDSELRLFAEQMSGKSGLDKAAALAVLEALPVSQQAPFIQQIFFDELQAGGRSAAPPGPHHNDYTRAYAALTTLFPGANPDVNAGQKVPYQGDLLLYFSRIYTLQGGNIDLLAPGGQINVGLAAAPAAFGIQKGASQLGIVAQREGTIDMLGYGDVQVNQSRVFSANGGNILMWSTEGDIDAGRGSKTAISAPPPTVVINPRTGAVTLQFPPALTGSGIQALASDVGVKAGDVDLFAPHGVVNANDAGIVAGNLTIAATAVLGANNITVSGTSVGVPVEVTGLGASLSSAGNSSAAASNVAQSGLSDSDSGSKQAPRTEAALNWLDVFVLGVGEETCRTDDLDCIKRQKH